MKLVARCLLPLLFISAMQVLDARAQVTYYYPSYSAGYYQSHPISYCDPSYSTQTYQQTSSCPTIVTNMMESPTSSYMVCEVVTDSCGNQFTVAKCVQTTSLSETSDRMPEALQGSDTPSFNSAKWTAVRLNNVNPQDLQFCLTYKSRGVEYNSPCYFVPQKTAATVYLAGIPDIREYRGGERRYELAIDSIDPVTGEKKKLGAGLKETEARISRDGMLQLDVNLAIRKNG